MNQISNKADKELNRLSREIGEAESLIEAGTLKKDNAWERVVEFFDEFGKEGREARFIADDGHYLHKQERTAQPKLDEEKLHVLIYQTYPKGEATKLWNSITTRKVDQVNLEAAKNLGKIDASLIISCITPGKKTFARVRKEWTKDDRERAQILGIEKKD